MRYLTRIAAFLLTFSLTFAVLAGEASLTWVNPTTNTDNTGIPATCPAGQTQCGKLTFTRMEYGSCSGTAFGTKVGEIMVPAPGQAAIVNNLVPQMFCFRAFARNDYTNESIASNVALKTIVAPTPKPPTGLTALAGATAYAIKPDYTGFGPMQRGGIVGTLKVNALCTARQRIYGTDLYRVPKAAVAFTANPQDYVVAACA